MEKDFPTCDIVEVSNLERLEEACSSAAFDLVITDYQMFWTDGLQVVQRVIALWPNAAIIMFTGTGNEEIAVQAMKAGVDDYVLKSPDQTHNFRAAVQKALRTRK